MSFLLLVFLGVFLADFLSGVIHWLQDRYAKPSWPIVGGAVADAHEHHTNPGKMLKASFWKRNGAAMILVGLIGSIIALFGGLNVVTVTALITGAFANEIHGYTHRYGVPQWVRVFRFIGLFQTPAHHAKHHRPRSRKAYCVITSWLNPALDHVKFWDGLEFVLFIFAIWPTPEKGRE